MPELRVGGHAVDIRGTALGVTERMGLDTAVRDARTKILTLSAVRPDGRRTYDVALRPLHETRGDREIEIMRDDLVHILFGAIADDVEVVFGDEVRTVVPQDGARVGVEFERGAPREVDLTADVDMVDADSELHLDAKIERLPGQIAVDIAATGNPTGV